MQERIMCADGKRRKATRKQCLRCGKEFLAENRRPRDYCSNECRLAPKRLKLSCSWCGTKFERRKSQLLKSRSGLSFCSRDCKDKAQALGENSIKEIQPPHYGTGTGEWNYRTKFYEEELSCSRCGYNEFICSVQIHHIDRDRTNNSKENLIPLCACCHAALHQDKWSLEELR